MVFRINIKDLIQREMACPCSSHFFCLQLCSDIVNGLISAVFIAVVKASFFDKSVIQLKSKLTVTRVLILETRDSIWIYSKLFPLFSFFIRKLSCVSPVLISSGCQVATAVLELFWLICYAKFSLIGTQNRHYIFAGYILKNTLKKYINVFSPWCTFMAILYWCQW